LAEHLLDDDGHLLLTRRSTNGCQVGFGFGEECGRVDELDGLIEAGEARVLLDFVVGNHLGAVDAGEGVIEIVLEQARRAHGERRVDVRDQTTEIADVLSRQLRLLDRVRDAVVREIRGEDVFEVVSFDEAVEEIGGQDGRRRDGDLYVRKLVRIELGEDFLTHPQQAGRLAAERSVADPRERALRAEKLTIESRNAWALSVHRRSFSAIENLTPKVSCDSNSEF
jgi:hypothetical protein